MQYISHNTEETIEIGKKIGEMCKAGTVISLRGSLGAGKTVIAKGIAKYLKIEESIVSPTFTIIQEYNGTLPLYHMDLYRISGCDEFEMLGGEEMLYGNGITLIEWSEKIEEMLPEETIFIDIEIKENLDRIITITNINEE